MKTYTVSVSGYWAGDVDVEAESAEEAQELASDYSPDIEWIEAFIWSTYFNRERKEQGLLS